MTRLGYQIPNFTYPGVATNEIFDNIVNQAKTAEASGFDRVLLMDHFYQLPGIGDPDDYMLECYTTLAALAQHTEKVRLGALVVVDQRNPVRLVFKGRLQGGVAGKGDALTLLVMEKHWG